MYNESIGWRSPFHLLLLLAFLIVWYGLGAIANYLDWWCFYRKSTTKEEDADKNREERAN